MEDIEAIVVLQDPVRRQLYEYVVAQEHEVSRNEAAEGAGIGRTLAAFHLDKLVDAGLLATESRRLTGRSGPGAGRPSSTAGPVPSTTSRSPRGTTAPPPTCWPRWRTAPGSMSSCGPLPRGRGGPRGPLPDLYRRDDPLSTSALADAQLLAEQRDAELRKLTDELGDVQRSLHQVRQERGELEERRNIEVVKPAEQVRARLIRATARSLEAARLTEQPAMLPFSGSTDVADEAGWAADVVAQAGALVAACRAETTTQAGIAQAAQDRITKVLHDAEVADELELEKRHRKLVGDIAIEEGRRDTALSELPLSAELDRRIAAARPVVSGLRELHRLLADGKFPAAVVRRRQRALLGAASELLESMTGRRFSFAPDFRVVDLELGIPRDVRTLSGGETFLASLALALAELTSRGGARVEALFLDEGFGTLDANALDEALDALARQAGEDRLVAVISHVRSVAANVDDILLVTRNFSGSQARWLTATERDQIVTAEIDKGLLE